MNFFKSLLLAATMFVGAAHACTPVMLQPGAKGNGLCYGDRTWAEPTVNGKILHQTFNFWASPNNPNAPLIIYFHPNGQTANIGASSPLYAQIISPALAAGYAVASVEFRHPVTNEGENNGTEDVRVPHWDIARAVQFIRANASALGIDKRNVFFAAQSRGTLSLWVAMQPDMANAESIDPVARESTRARAVWGYQAQTTYRGDEFANAFLVQADRAAFISSFQTEHPKYEQFGSAVASVTTDAPPVVLRYKGRFVTGLVTLNAMNSKYDSLHYPNYGRLLCTKYASISPYLSCTAQDGIPEGTGFEGMIKFFDANKLP